MWRGVEVGTSHLLWLKSFWGEQNWLCFRNTTSCAGLHQINLLGRLSMAEWLLPVLLWLGCSRMFLILYMDVLTPRAWDVLARAPDGAVHEGGRSML